MKPPFPAIEGLYASPTIVNNVETLAHVCHILRNGPEWYRGRGLAGAAGIKLFSLSGSSVILSPYRDANEKVIGVLGVIGPTRLNYARIVPVVDYTAQAVSAIMARKKT